MLTRRRTLVGVAATLGMTGYAGMSRSQEREQFPSRPPLGNSEDVALRAARDWLSETQVRDVRRFALGEERRWYVDQTTRSLTLVHPDQLRLELNVEMLGSFNPRNGTFRWAWSNNSVEPSFARASEAIRRHPETIGFESFEAPIFRAAFEDCQDLVALAARLSGFAGIYRAITSDHVSAFLGYAQPTEGDVARLWSAGRASAEDEIEALRLIGDYDAAMLPFDAEYGALLQPLKSDYQSDAAVRYIESNSDVISGISRRKYDAHRRFWRRDDDYWIPGLYWPSPHDPQRRSAFFAAARRAGGVYVIRGDGSVLPDAFVLLRFAEGMRIVDRDLEWGSGLLIR